VCTIGIAFAFDYYSVCPSIYTASDYQFGKHSRPIWHMDPLLGCINCHPFSNPVIVHVHVYIYLLSISNNLIFKIGSQWFKYTKKARRLQFIGKETTLQYPGQ
jgi:hypothetical protein